MIRPIACHRADATALAGPTCRSRFGTSASGAPRVARLLLVPEDWRARLVAERWLRPGTETSSESDKTRASATIVLAPAPSTLTKAAREVGVPDASRQDLPARS